ncbi:MAG: 4-hydroxythreonine-4-phosphate dehydrogenase PdxA, partial [Deefgea sp.]
MHKPLAITTGEPAGIGPELSIKLAQSNIPNPIVLLADRQLLIERANCVGLNAANIAAWPDYEIGVSAPISIWHHPLATPS